ncbi:hypothetical protein HanXRQr2_Chr17g0817651 [Helianthus annuus]|uniref:Uncharacterized protein n=1 Tax=Helianthus annuus TaxID=4232 RepID=A0A9K3DL99_HELAN|nr:hypothetical protein HanXRQr2_Chr17g0817651 [Helianthus annuus]
MADSPSPTKTHIPSSPSAATKPPKSKSLFTNYYFSKSIMIILVLLVFFYFPSQVPEMFKETTLIPKLWDLIYLLVIGIAVSYGLFSRKIDSVHLSDDNIGENETYLSGISHISSIFEDGNHGIGSLYGFDEKSWVESKGLGSRFSEIGGGKKALKQCFLGESLVVINDEKYVLEQLGSRQKTVRQNLGSKSLDSAVGKSVVEDSDSDSRNWFKESKSGKFRGMVPVKLDEKFKESGNDSGSDSDSRTRLNRRSKSMRLEKHDDMFTAEENETVVRFGMPSKTKSFSEKEESKGEEAIEVNHRYRKPSYLNGETSFVEAKVQEPSAGGFTEINQQKKKSRFSATEAVKDYDGTSDEEIVKDFGKIKADDGAFDSKNNKQFVRSKSQSSSTGASSETLRNMLRKEEKADMSSSIPKPATNVKRGKSVRTNRSKEQVVESKGNMFQIHTDDAIVETRSKPGTDEMNVNVNVNAADELSDTEPHSGEVDRKAEEFIAKFKEQIRLQKVASARKLNLL